MKKITFFLLFALFFTAACGPAETGDNEGGEEENTEENAENTSNNEEMNDMSEEPNIVELAMDTEALSTLVAAVKAGGLVETLQGEGPFTVFAPTNAAFDALPEGTLDDLLKPENKEQLATILKYHVVSGKVMSGDLSDGMTAETVAGEEITVSINEGTVKVNEATVTNPDVAAANGVVHVIDQVLLPASN